MSTGDLSHRKEKAWRPLLQPCKGPERHTEFQPVGRDLEGVVGGTVRQGSKRRKEARVCPLSAAEAQDRSWGNMVISPLLDPPLA